MGVRAWDVRVCWLLLVLYGAALGVRPVAAEWSGVCDTSANSPTTKDLEVVIAGLTDGCIGYGCCHRNIWGSKCDTLCSFGTASIIWCNKDYPDSIRCDKCGSLQSSIREKLLFPCTQSFDGVERVGGWLESSIGDKSWGYVLMLRN